MYTEIALNDLETTLAASPEQKHAVLLTMKDCEDCTANEERLKTTFESVPEIKWYKVYLTDTTPFFAPSVVPSVVFFEGRNRLIEGFGLIEVTHMEAFTQYVRSSLGLLDDVKYISSFVE